MLILVNPRQKVTFVHNLKKHVYEQMDDGWTINRINEAFFFVYEYNPKLVNVEASFQGVTWNDNRFGELMAKGVLQTLMNCSSDSLEIFSAHWFKEYHFVPDMDQSSVDRTPVRQNLLTGSSDQNSYSIFGNFKMLKKLTIHECYLEEDYLIGANNLEELIISNTKYLLNTPSNTKIIRLSKLQKFTLILDDKISLANFYQNLKIDLRTVHDLHIMNHFLTHDADDTQNDAVVDALMTVVCQLKQLHKLNLDLNVPIPFARLQTCLRSMNNLESFGTILYFEDSNWRNLICNVNKVKTFIVDYVHSSSASTQSTEESIQSELLSINDNIESISYSNWKFTIHCKSF